MTAGILLHDVDTFIECRLLIAHPNRPSVLTVRQANAWALPVLTPIEHHAAAVDHINLAVFRLFGLRTFVRRLVHDEPGHTDYRAILRYYEMEVIGELARQRIGRTAWAGRVVLDEMEFESKSDREMIEAWLAEFESVDPSDDSRPVRPPWSLPGWFENASSWVQRHATGKDKPTQAIPDQCWTDDRLAILSSPSDTGIVVMTATGSPGTPDSQDTEEWASRLGWARPELIFDDTARNWRLYRTGHLR
ncbi:MAG: hypothetical protein QF554_12925 [Dehalococcoidia bacterium]|nr:hypothetical protein [Dehalococcoidia bacterium]